MAANSAKSALKIAIEICTSDSFKEAFIYPTGESNGTLRSLMHRWGQGIYKHTDKYYENNDVDETMTDMVTGLVFCISHRMLTWLEHHTNVLRIPAHVCLSLLTPGVFTEEGIIDDSKTVELLEDETLTNKKRYRLASWHCLRERSLSFFNMLDFKTKSVFFGKKVTDISETAIVKFWAYYFSGEFNLLKDKKEVYAVGRLHNPCIIGAPEDENTLRTVTIEDIKGDDKGEKKSYLKFMLESAIFSGSKPAVEFCVNDTLTKIESFIKNTKSSGKQKNMEYWVDLKEKKESEILDVLIGVVAHKMQIGMYYYHEKKNVVDDHVVFRRSKYNYKTELWVPSHFLVDTFFYLFSKLSSEEKRRIPQKLKEAIHLNSRIRTVSSKKLFNYFLCWPYQDQLMELVNSCWDHIEYDYFVSLLFDIFERIFPSIDTFHYGENKAFDYVQLFAEFWCSTPDDFKRYIFEDRKEYFELPDTTEVSNCGECLMAMMFDDEYFYKHHFSIIEKFLNSMTLIERKRMMNTSEGQLIYDIIKRKTYSYLDSLFEISTESEDEGKQLRKRLDSGKDFLDMLKNDEYDEVDSFLNTLRLTDEQLLKKKEKIIYCDDGIRYFIQLGTKNPEKFRQFVNWFVQSSCSKFYKWHITLLEETKRLCLNKSINEPELADQYLRFCYSLRSNSNTKIYESVEEFKYNLAIFDGIKHCLRLLFGYSCNKIDLPMTERLSQLDKFLDWVFKTQPFDEEEEKKEDDKEEGYENVIKEMEEDKENDQEINDKMIKIAKKTIKKAKIMIKEAEKITKVDKLSSNEMDIMTDRQTKEKKADGKEVGNENKKKEIKKDEESERERNDKMKIEKVKKTIKEAKTRNKEAEKKINEAEKKITEADKLSSNEMYIPVTDGQTKGKKEDGKEEGYENKIKEIKVDEDSEHERNDKVVIEKAKKTIKEAKIRIKEAKKKIKAAEKKITKVEMHIKVIKRKNKYKKKLFQDQNETIHYNFIKYRKFDDAECFFSWAGISSEDLKKSKSELFTCTDIENFFHKDMKKKTQNPKDQSFKKNIDKFLRYCLVDQKTVDGFKEKFEKYVNDPEIVDGISKIEKALLEKAS